MLVLLLFACSAAKAIGLLYNDAVADQRPRRECFSEDEQSIPRGLTGNAGSSCFQGRLELAGQIFSRLSPATLKPFPLSPGLKMLSVLFRSTLRSCFVRHSDQMLHNRRLSNRGEGLRARAGWLPQAFAADAAI
jgi:hypothetical protein